MRLFSKFACLIVGLCGVASLLHAQSPAPAPKQAGPVLILGATAHIGDGTLIPNSAVAFEDGKITMVADATTIRIDQSRYAKIFDASGKQLFPGFIGMNSRLGLVEIDAVRATQDFSETGAFNPNARAIIAYNTDSDLIPTVRSNGVLLAQICPSGGVLSGASSVVALDAWNWEDAAVRMDEGLHLNWPSRRQWRGWGNGNPQRQANERYAKEVEALKRFFDEAAAYVKESAPAVRNPRFESMRALFAGKQTLYIRVNEATPMQEAVLFAKKYGLKPTLTGASDAWLIADFLAQEGVSLVLGRTQSLPARDDDDIDQPFKTPAMLHEKGVRFCFSEEGAWRQRNTPFQAGQAVAYGLPYEAAVRALTLDAATVLGISDRLGSIEMGKEATLFISEGDPLDMRGNRVIAAFIAGREIELDDKHKQLYRRYEKKYKQR